jgi:tripartite-type tricarboxylate transporter receptor subunit TctC
MKFFLAALNIDGVCKNERGGDVTRMLCGLLLAALSSLAYAQYPSKAIRVVVPFPAGSATDTISRVLAHSVSQSIGQTLVVENKAGADGAIAAAEVAKAAPDGYTLIMATNSPMSAVPAMKKNPPYDPVADFTPITDIGRYSFFIVVHPGVPAKTLAELIDYARANPGKINYATGNTTGIVSTAYFASLAKIELVHVPYKGEPQALTDLVAGRVQMMFCSSSTSVPQIREGKLRPLVTTLGKRSHLLPDVPTIGEAGMPQFSITSWAGLFAPARTPREVVERLNKEFAAAMARPDVQAAMERQAFSLSPSSPEQLAAFVKEQMESYRRILRAAGVQPE